MCRNVNLSIVGNTQVPGASLAIVHNQNDYPQPYRHQF